MATFRGTIQIDAPVEEIRAFIGDPANLPVIWPGLLDVTQVRYQPNGIYTFQWTCKMAGVLFQGHSQGSASQSDGVVYSSQDGLAHCLTWAWQPGGAPTAVTLSARYAIPVPLLTRLAEPTIVAMTERELESILVNLKLQLEG